MTYRLSLLLGLVPTLASCATFIESRRDDGTGEGLRYSLPAPFLIVTPQSDGTLRTSIELLPDPNRTYVLRTRSMISSYTLDVQLENQMLRSVSLNANAAATAEQLAESAGNVAAHRIDARQAAAGQAETARTTAATALREAELNLEIAEATLDELQNSAGVAADVLLQARLEVREATVRRDAALRTVNSTPNALASANAPGSDGALMAAGPMIFRIVPTADQGVQLVAVRGPASFPTSTAARVPVAGPGTTTSGPIRVRPDQAGDLKFDVVFNRPVLRVVSVDLRRSDDPLTVLQDLQPTTTIAAVGSGTKFSFILERQLEAGNYLIVMSLEVRNETNGTDTIREMLQVRVDR